MPCKSCVADGFLYFIPFDGALVFPLVIIYMTLFETSTLTL